MSQEPIDVFAEVEKELNLKKPVDPYMPSAEVLGRMPTHEEFCEAFLRKAHDKGYPDPDFDYRHEYFKGQKLYYAYVNVLTGEKTSIPLSVRTIYPRSMVLIEEQGMCRCVGYNDKDCIFLTAIESDDYLNGVEIEAKFGPESEKIDNEE